MLPLLEFLQSTNIFGTIIILIVFILVVKGIWEALEWFISKIGITTKRQRELDRITKLAETHDIQFEEMIDTLERIQKASRESLLFMINNRYKKYQEIGYIPQDEYEQFVSLHDAYNGVGGNHIGDMKFERIINDYEVR